MARTLEEIDAGLAAIESQNLNTRLAVVESTSYPQLAEAFRLLKVRVNQLDGQNLVTPSTATVATLSREIDGLRTTIGQVALTLQGMLDDLKTKQAELQTLVEAGHILTE